MDAHENGRFDDDARVEKCSGDPLANKEPPPPPSSEVGCNQRPGDVNRDTDMWKMLMEQQNKNLMALLETIKPSPVSTNIILPEFDPDKANVDPRSWIAAADMCVTNKQLTGASLMMALSRSLKGQASSWLSQISFEGMTWTDFKEVFVSRYDCSDTVAAFLINLSASKPKDNECLSAYAARMMTSLMSRWSGLSTEQLAIATIMSHIAQFEPRAQRIAFTSNITTRSEMQRELKAVTYLKRRNNGTEKTEPDAKRFNPTTPLKCFNCGKMGHRAASCRIEKDGRKDYRAAASPSANSSSSNSSGHSKPVSTLTCFKCGQPGHIATRCTSSDTKAGGAASGASAERRVDLCVVNAPSGTL